MIWKHQGYGIYQGITYASYQEHINRYAFAANFVESKTVLDLACGTGYGAEFLKTKGARIVVGGDVSQAIIEYATKNHNLEGLFFSVLAAEQMPFPDDSFDVLIALQVIEHLNEPEKFLRECKRVLCKGGIFICSTPNGFFSRGSARCSEFHVREYKIDEFSKMINSLFIHTRLWGQTFMGPVTMLKPLVFSRFSKLLSYLPMGSKIRDLLRGVSKWFISRTAFSAEPKFLDRYLDKKYQVKPPGDRKLSIPRHIIIVASEEAELT